jgi:protein kinase C-binding protein NELL
MVSHSFLSHLIRLHDFFFCSNNRYFCHCKPGYETIGNDCIDIDECSHRTHSCHSTAQCVNTEGHFECQCTENDGPDCRLSCMYEDNEISDGKTISPRNQPCKQCTCSKGVISCVEPQCNCSLWRRGNSRDLCCPQCDPDESCRHQELPHVTFKSGEQWIYQCQTCECLVSFFFVAPQPQMSLIFFFCIPFQYGEYDCWKLECPPLACDNPLPLAPGDCCPRCPDDLLCSSNSTKIGSKSCTYGRHTYPSGHTFRYPSRDCATCTCKVMVFPLI